MRNIHEGRMGPPKSFKTGAVVGSYPKPMLVLSLDPGGLDVLPTRGATIPGDLLTLDSCYEDIEWCTPTDLPLYLEKAESDLPRILAIDFSIYRFERMSALYVPAAQAAGYERFIDVLNMLTEKCPFKTVVVDPATGLCDIVHQHLASTNNAKKLEDAMKWAPDVGYQVIKTQGTLSILPCHTVMTLHETSKFELNKDRKSTLKEIRPMLPSQYARERIGGLFAQYIYQHRTGNKIEVLTADEGYISAGLGCRWPLGLPTSVGPLFQDIYGGML